MNKSELSSQLLKKARKETLLSKIRNKWSEYQFNKQVERDFGDEGREVIDLVKEVQKTKYERL